MGDLPETLTTRALGPTPLAPTTFGLGCWALAGEHWGGQDATASQAALGAAFEAGINYFDTSAADGNGHGEELVGRFVRPRREQIFLASKALLERPTARAMQRAVDDSLLRLNVDVLDLYCLQWPVRGYDLRFAHEGLVKAREAGKVRGLGLSNCSAKQVHQVREIGPVDAVYACFSLLWRQAARELLPYCQEAGIPVLAYGVLAQGILTGKFGKIPVFRPGDLRAKTVFYEDDVWPAIYAAVERLQGVAAAAQRPLTQLAIRWVLAQPGITGVLVGARDAAQVRTNLGALAGEPPSVDTLTALTEISDGIEDVLPKVANIWRFEP